MDIAFSDDLDLGLIAESGQCFRWEHVAPLEWRIVAFGRSLYAAHACPGVLRLSCTEDEFASVWRDYLDLDEDYAGIRGRVVRERDPFLASAMDAGRGIRILRQDLWETLVSFIISQNRNIGAIRRSIELLAKRCGEPLVDVRGRCYHAFPGPDAVAGLTDADLRACGLGYRAPYVHGAAVAVATGKCDLEALRGAPDSEALERLMRLKGVGVKVASCVILFGLHRLDAFPVDVWIRRALERAYPDGFPFSEYSPYNGVYQQYLFAYLRGANAHPPMDTAVRSEDRARV